MIRLYLGWRVYTGYSNWNDERAYKVCNENRIFGGVKFALKCEFKERPFSILTVVILFSIVIFGIALRNFE